MDNMSTNFITVHRFASQSLFRIINNFFSNNMIEYIAGEPDHDVAKTVGKVVPGVVVWSASETT